MQVPHRKGIMPYLVCILVVLLVIWMRTLFSPVIGGVAPYIPLAPIIMILAAIYGFGPALCCSVIGSYLMEVWNVEPSGIFTPSLKTYGQMLIVIFSAGIIGLLADQLRVARRAAEDRLQAFMDHSPALAWMKDEQGRYLFLNKEYERSLNLATQNWYGKTDFELWTQASAEIFQRDDRDVLTQERPRKIEEKTTDRQGKINYWLTHKFPICDTKGKHFIGGIAIDITHQKNVEFQLQQKERSLQALMQALPVGVSFSEDASCQRVVGNPAMLAQFELKSADNLAVIAPDFSALQRQVHFYSEGREISADELPLRRAITENRTIAPMEIEVRLPSGRVWYAEVIAAPIHDEHGNVIRSVAVTVDITTRKQALDALRESERCLRENERIYRAIADSIDYGVWICDPEGQNIYVSESFHQLVGLSQAQCAGLGWVAACHPDDAERTVTAWQQCVQHGHHWDIEHRFRGVDGAYHPVLSRGVPVRDEHGKTLYWAGINLDISRLKSIENALAIADQANQAKTKFLATMSHDLRTPLNAIIGFSELTLAGGQEGTLSSRQKENIALIAKSGRHLLHLVEELLNLSAIESGKLSMQKEWFDLAPMLRDLSKSYQLMVREKGIEWECEIKTSRKVFADQHRLTEVMNNLVNNAIKYTPAGGTITLGAQESAERVTLFIKDTGNGIDKDDLERIFTPFEQGKQPPSYKTGKGLGLAISQHIIKDHDSTLMVESTKGKGSCFSFTLPLEDPSKAQASASDRLEPLPNEPPHHINDAAV